MVPALAETEFGVARGSFMMLVAFVLAFGVVKAVMNFAAGRLAERLGRRPVLILGWVLAVPIPVIIYLAPSWSWIVLATVLLGINQGLTWSMTQTAKLDLAGPEQRGRVIGLNECVGYAGVAIAGVATGYAASTMEPRLALLVFGSGVVAAALLVAARAVVETLPWATFESAGVGSARTHAPGPSTWQVFVTMSWGDRRMAAFCQAGLVEKFVDALVWVFWPIYLYRRGVSLADIGWIAGAYGLTWGVFQLFTGRWSDRVGRHRLNVAGMFTCALGVAGFVCAASFPTWGAAAVVTGFGMALLYPNLSAAVADLAAPAWRASAIGIYRFWRDLGYGVGAVGLGIAATLTGAVEAAFWFVVVAMALSGIVLAIWGQETRPPVAESTGPR